MSAEELLMYLLGRKSGTGVVVLEDGDYVFSDPNGDGNIIIEKEE